MLSEGGAFGPNSKGWLFIFVVRLQFDVEFEPGTPSVWERDSCIEQQSSQNSFVPENVRIMMHIGCRTHAMKRMCWFDLINKGWSKCMTMLGLVVVED